MASKVFISFSVLFYCSYAYFYLWEQEIFPITPAYMFAVTISVGLLIALLRYGWVLPPPKYRNLIYWVIAFLLLSAMSVSFTNGGEVANQHLTHYAQGSIMLVVFCMLMRSSWVVSVGVKALVAVVLLGVVLNILDFFAVTEFTNVEGRAAGFYVNPNTSSFYLILGFCTSVLSLPKKHRFSYAVVVFMGVFLTFSRSGILICGVAIAYLSLIGAYKLSRVPSMLLAGIVSLSVVLAFTSGRLVDLLTTSSAEQYITEDVAYRISGKEQKDHSVQNRAEIAKKGVDVFLENPLLGIGVGGAIELLANLNTHNVFVQSAVEMGVVGLALLFILFFLIWKVGTHETNMFLLTLFMLGFFHHKVLDEPAFYILVALVVSVSTRHTTDYPPFVRRIIKIYWSEGDGKNR